MHIQSPIHTRIYSQTRPPISLHRVTYICMYVCMYVCMYACVYMYNNKHASTRALYILTATHKQLGHNAGWPLYIYMYIYVYTGVCVNTYTQAKANACAYAYIDLHITTPDPWPFAPTTLKHTDTTHKTRKRVWCTTGCTQRV